MAGDLAGLLPVGYVQTAFSDSGISGREQELFRTWI